MNVQNKLSYLPLMAIQAQCGLTNCTGPNKITVIEATLQHSIQQRLLRQPGVQHQQNGQRHERVPLVGLEGQRVLLARD